ncbi:unnamed protein product [Ostreobium quekettii]|uniref:Suppressor of forked domain-containing protein n=1 Tax=Ostreobium quekettii TaxID=121088 RepID=A0A8S1IYG6_9CHLO|nr:unnamed protein product [Ostreobium quekettii]
MSFLQVENLKTRLRENKYDVGAWEQLMGHYRGGGNSRASFVERQEVYEELLAVFPTAAGYWKAYAEAAMAVNEHGRVKSIFSQCLLNCLNVDLWTTYLRFIKKVNQQKASANGVKEFKEVREAYEFTLDRVGQDINSGPVWQEYINFLQSPKPGTPAYKALFADEGIAGQEEAHRVTVLRRQYQRAVAVPTHRLDTIWKAYENFEKTGTSKTLGRNLLDEHRSRYMSARRVYNERKSRLEGIRHTALAVPPGEGGPQQQEQIGLWLKYLEFEKSNPQRLDQPSLVARVSLAYDQALMCLVHHPEIWNDYARFHIAGGGTLSAVKVLDRARTCLPNCLMLHFALADVEESEGHIEKAKDVYEELVRCLEGMEEKEEGSRSKDRLAGVDLSDQAALIWITYMRFLRRAETQKTSRELFIRATKSGSCPWEVYVAGAMLEWRSKEQDVVVRIFEKGMRKHLGNPDFVLQYINFLLGINDLENTRAVFERALMLEPCQKSQAMWEKYIQVLYEVGDITFARDVEERKRAALGDTTTNNIHSLISRYRFLDIWPMAQGIQTDHMKRVLGMMAPPPMMAGPQAQRAWGPGMQREAEPLRLPPVLGNFINRLPTPTGAEGVVPDAEEVMAGLRNADLSMASISRQCMEAEGMGGGKLHDHLRGDDANGRRRGRFDDEGDGMYPVRSWEPSMDEYRMRMKRKMMVEQQEVAAKKAAAKAARNGMGAAIEVP